jgi:hypothetical protein
VLYDADAVYVAARMYDSHPGEITARLGRRDAEGWTAEIRIPLSQLRFSGTRAQTWGLDFERYILRTDETVRWAWAPNTEAGFASRFGHLAGVRDVSRSRLDRLELMPYVVTQRDAATGVDPANPYHLAGRGSAAVGADFKYGVSSGLTLTGTVNPDFGQVEADPAEVNLSVFETYFQERRPFFVEGASLFAFPSAVYAAPQLFYSRRVGRPPAGPVPSDARFADRPEVTTILGAAKLSGKVGRWSVGALSAVTARERADWFAAADRTGRATVEPAADYSVFSLQRDYRRGASGVGVLATNVYRQIDTVSLRGLRSSAQAGGIDFFHRFGRNRWSINGTVSGSVIRGDSVAILAAQRSSVRYYQRPDQDYARLDPGARSLGGYNVSLSGGKIAGAWLVGSDFFATSPGFEVNDVGFLQLADRIFHGVRVTRRWLQPTRRFRYAQLYATASNQWNYGGTRVAGGFFAGGSGQLRNYWTASLNASVNPASLNDRITRGGPLEVIPPQWGVSGTLATDARRAATATASGNVVRNRSGGYANAVSLGLAARPTSAVSVSVTPGFNATHSAAGYVAAPPDSTATAMYGRRYVVSDLTQRTLDLTTRLDVALTPSLSMQLYAQPFVSSARYTGYKAFVRPRAFEFLVYGRDAGSTIAHDAAARVFRADADGPGPAPTLAFADPDFRVRSLRSNLVVRWEYRPGSALFFAWAHGREGFDGDASFDAFRDLRALRRDDHRDRLLVKASYWINP